MNTLPELQSVLIEGLKLAMQGSYQRRAPSENAIPYLLKAQKGLSEYVQQYPDNALAWSLLSQAEECLLNYHAAIVSLKKAIELKGSDKKSLKRLVMLQECQKQWQELSMTAEQLKSLESYLGSKIDKYGCDHTLTLTKEWLDKNITTHKELNILNGIQNQGGYCDCEVLMNVCI